MSTFWAEGLDLIFHALHILVILVNLFAWIPRRTRRLHRLVVLTTAASWLLPAPWFGLGYCFLTDWHWDLKVRLGQGPLPRSYVDYLLQCLGFYWEPTIIDSLVGLAFGFVALVAGLQWWRETDNARVAGQS